MLRNHYYDLVDLCCCDIQEGLFENTLIIFSSDNGGDLSKNNWPLRGSKYSDFEGGIRTAALVSGGYLPANVRGTVNSKCELLHQEIRTSR